MSKKLLSIALILSTCLTIPLFSQFSLPKTGLTDAVAKPEARITKFELDSISLRDITFFFELTVKNPYPVNLSFSGMSLDFAVEGSSVFKVKDQGGFTVPANKEAPNTFKVTLTYEAIAKVVKEYQKKDVLDTNISGVLTIPLPKIAGLPPDISFNYSLNQKIPTLKPQLSLQKFSVRGPSLDDVKKGLVLSASKVDPEKVTALFGDLLSGKKVEKPVIQPSDIDVPISISFTIAISNEAQAPIGFNELAYALSLDGESLIKAKSTNIKTEGKTTFITIDSTFSTKSLSASLQKLFQKRSGSFTVEGSAALLVPKEIRKTPVPLSFKESGNFSF